MDESYDTAEDLLVRNRTLLEKLSKELIEVETVDANHSDAPDRGVRRGRDPGRRPSPQRPSGRPPGVDARHQGTSHTVGVGDRTLGPGPVLVGVLNVTPDSFSDGGDFLDPAKAAPAPPPCWTRARR